MIINRIDYLLYSVGKEFAVQVEPVYLIISGKLYNRGIFNIKANNVDLGDFVFNNNMDQWDCVGLREFTQEQINNLAKFIRLNQLFIQSN